MHEHTQRPTRGPRSYLFETAVICLGIVVLVLTAQAPEAAAAVSAAAAVVAVILSLVRRG